MPDGFDGKTGHLLTQNLDKGVIGVSIGWFFRLQARAKGLLSQVDQEMRFFGKAAFPRRTHRLALEDQTGIPGDPGFQDAKLIRMGKVSHFFFRYFQCDRYAVAVFCAVDHCRMVAVRRQARPHKDR